MSTTTSPNNSAQQGEQHQEPQESNIPPKPQQPEQPLCCGNGCEDCVMIGYFDEMKKYTEKLKEWETKYGKKKEGKKG